METEDQGESVVGKKFSLFSGLKDTRPWWMVLVLTLTPTLITSYFTYKASAVASRAKAIEAQQAAEDGYEEMVKAVQNLQKHDDEAVRAIADLNGHIKAIESMMILMRPHADASHSWRPSFPAQTAGLSESPRLDLPKSLGEVTAAKK